MGTSLIIIGNDPDTISSTGNC